MPPILNQYGLSGLVIATLSGVVVYLYRDSKGLQQKYNDLQELRLEDAKQIRDKIMEPLENQVKMSDKIYDLLLGSLKKGQ